jgi:hypothetical protein
VQVQDTTCATHDGAVRSLFLRQKLPVLHRLHVFERVLVVLVEDRVRDRFRVVRECVDHFEAHGC